MLLLLFVLTLSLTTIELEMFHAQIRDIQNEITLIRKALEDGRRSQV